MTTTNTPIVIIKNNAVVANSRDVADYFSKSHKHVLDSIDDLLSEAPSCGSDFRLTSFEVPMPRGGSRSERSYDMTRDGFTILAMGFTGKKALQFKLKYIEQFNAMEAELKAQAQPAAVTATSSDERVFRTVVLMQQQIITPLLQLVAELVRLQQKPS